jgi:hypothetical protein
VSDGLWLGPPEVACPEVGSQKADPAGTASEAMGRRAEAVSSSRHHSVTVGCETMSG